MAQAGSPVASNRNCLWILGSLQTKRISQSSTFPGTQNHATELVLWENHLSCFPWALTKYCGFSAATSVWEIRFYCKHDCCQYLWHLFTKNSVLRALRVKLLVTLSTEKTMQYCFLTLGTLKSMSTWISLIGGVWVTYILRHSCQKSWERESFGLSPWDVKWDLEGGKFPKYTRAAQKFTVQLENVTNIYSTVNLLFAQRTKHIPFLYS